MESKEGDGKASRRARLALLCALLAAFLGLKMAHDPFTVGRHREDSTLYYLVARSVAKGEGLRTPVSLYHQGLRDLPARSPIYPLWPLVLGGAGSVIGLERAARLVPEALYFVDLLLVYLLGNALAAEFRRRAGTARRFPWVDFGHLAVLLLGLNGPFFGNTSLCMTEGLAFGLLFAALLALPRAATHPLWAAIAGALGGLAYLTRSQFLLVPVALALALLITRRAGNRRAAALAAAGAVLVVLPWIVHLSSLPAGFEPRVLVDFTAYRETPALPRFSGFVEYGSRGEQLAGLASGLVVAFSPQHSESYAHVFGATLYLVPLALGLWLISALRSRPSVAAVAPSALFRGTVFTLLASLLPVHLMHGTFPSEWFFGDRHGLPMLLGILLAAAYLLGQRRPVQLLVLVLCAGTLCVKNPLWRMREEAETRNENRKELRRPEEAELAAWLDGHERPPTVVTPNCRALALWSSANFHWIRCDSSPEETRSLFENLPIDYLIVYSDERDCAFHQGLEPELERVMAFMRGSRVIDVYRWKRE